MKTIVDGEQKLSRSSFLKHCICRTTSKQFTAIPHVVKLDEFSDDAHTTAHNHNAPRPKKIAFLQAFA